MWTYVVGYGLLGGFLGGIAWVLTDLMRGGRS